MIEEGRGHVLALGNREVKPREAAAPDVGTLLLSHFTVGSPQSSLRD